jgi:rare lipoprotein A
MIAMNGRTPASGGNLRRRSLFDALPGGRRNNVPIAVAPAPQPVMMASAMPERSSRLSDIIAPGDPVLPDSGPYIPERPIGGLASDAERLALPLMSYADRRVAAAATPFDALGSLDMNADDVVASWKRVNGETTIQQQDGAPPQSSYLAAGSFTNAEEATTRANLLSSLGAVRIVRDTDAYSVVMHAEGPALDALARAAWQAGATDAFVVRSE